MNKESHDGPSRYCGSLYFPCPKESDLGLMPLESFPPQPSNQESQKDKANWSKFPHPPGPSLHLPLGSLSSPHQLQIRTSQSVDLPFKRCQNSLSKLSLHFFFKHCNFKPDFFGNTLRRIRELWENNLDLREQSLNLPLV